MHVVLINWATTDDWNNCSLCKVKYTFSLKLPEFIIICNWTNLRQSSLTLYSLSIYSHSFGKIFQGVTNSKAGYFCRCMECTFITALWFIWVDYMLSPSIFYNYMLLLYAYIIYDISSYQGGKALSVEAIGHTLYQMYTLHCD